jgi:hypothetical protein
MAIPMLVKITMTNPDELSPAAWKRAIREGWKQVAVAWAKEMLPEHFKPQAKGKYGYQQRTRRYLQNKIKAAGMGRVQDGGLSDLVYTGKLRDWVLGTVRITATAKGSAATTSGPKYLYVTPKKRADPDKRAEIEKIIDQERNELLRILDYTLQEEITKPSPPQISVVGFFHGD